MKALTCLWFVTLSSSLALAATPSLSGSAVLHCDSSLCRTGERCAPEKIVVQTKPGHLVFSLDSHQAYEIGQALKIPGDYFRTIRFSLPEKACQGTGEWGFGHELLFVCKSASARVQFLTFQDGQEKVLDDRPLALEISGELMTALSALPFLNRNYLEVSLHLYASGVVTAQAKARFSPTGCRASNGAFPAPQRHTVSSPKRELPRP